MMDEELGAPPGSPEEETGPPAPIAKSKAAGPVAKTGEAETSHESVNYTSAGERCETCEYFSEDQFHCNKNNFDCEPQGHCDKWEVVGDASGNDAAAGEATGPPAEDEEGAVDLEGEDLDLGDEEY
jgi:hypothetical protein